MTTLSFSDGDMSEFEKLADNLEFENKQYAKMIEKENQCILSLKCQIEKNKELIQRVESDISKMDEDTMRLHKQFVQSKETIKNLKDAFNMMMDHETSLTKQLESLKIRSEEEKQFYQEQMTNYTKIKDEYMVKYESFPLAIELKKKKEKLSEKQRETEELEAVITNLQQKIAEKEDLLDSKVLSRMIIKIARLKLSTLQTEKEIDKCLVEKTSLLEQLKEIQRIQEPPEAETQQVATLADKEEDNFMDCGDVTHDDNKIMDELPTRINDDVKNRTENEQSNGYGSQANDMFFTPMQAKVHEEILPHKELGQNNESHNLGKSDSNTSMESDERSNMPDKRPQEVNTIARTNNQKPTQSSLIGKGFTSYLSGLSTRIPTIPQVRPVQRAVPKIPTFKPIEHYKAPSTETCKDPQPPTVSVPKPLTQKLTVPTFTRKIQIPTLSVPRFQSSSNRFTDSVKPLKEPTPSRKPMLAVDTRKQQPPPPPPASSKPLPPSTSFATTTNFSLPKLPEISTSSATHSASHIKSLGQPSNSSNVKVSTGGNNCQGPLSSFSAKGGIINKHDKTEAVVKPQSLKQNTSENTSIIAGVGIQYGEQKKRYPEENDKEQPKLGFSLNNVARDAEMDAPLFKPTSMADSIRQTNLAQMSSPKPTGVKASTNSRITHNEPPTPMVSMATTTTTPSSSKKYSLGSIFNQSNKEHSQSPTAFSLINLGNEGNNSNRNGSDDPETPFLSFCDSSGGVIGGGAVGSSGSVNGDGPTSLFNLFNSSYPGESENENTETSAFNFNFDRSNDEKDEDNNKGSFFNFGKSRDENDSGRGGGGGGGFFNFGKDADEEEDKKGSLFNLF